MVERARLHEPPIRKNGNVPKEHTKWTVRAIREWAFQSGELPHVLLLRVSRGEKIGKYKPTFEDRVDAAKAVASYFAPKMQAIAVQDVTPPQQQPNTFIFDAAKLGALSDEELTILERVFDKLDGGSHGNSGSKTITASPDEYKETLDD